MQRSLGKLKKKEEKEFRRDDQIDGHACKWHPPMIYLLGAGRQPPGKNKKRRSNEVHWFCFCILYCNNLGVPLSSKNTYSQRGALVLFCFVFVFCIVIIWASPFPLKIRIRNIFTIFQWMMPLGGKLVKFKFLEAPWGIPNGWREKIHNINCFFRCILPG